MDLAWWDAEPAQRPQDWGRHAFRSAHVDAAPAHVGHQVEQGTGGEGIVTQFAAQCIAVILIRRLRKDIVRPFSMPLYPIPALVALAGWLFILASSGGVYVLSGFALLIFGIAAYLWRARRTGIWPWNAEITKRTV